MNRKLCVVAAILAAAVTLCNLAYLIKDSFFYSLDNLPEGTFVRDDFNQDVLFSTQNMLKVYQVEATKHFPAAVRVELYNGTTGERRTIYWQIGTEGSIISWSENSDTFVTINGVPIDFSESTYDCRDFENFTPTLEQ